MHFLFAGGLGLVPPGPTEKMATMFRNHCDERHHSHYQENNEEDYCNHQDRHAAPLATLCVANKQQSVISITDGSEVE
jgi:hypothetical protein